MKKIILVCLAVATVATVNAQARFGIKGGAGWTGYNISMQDLSPSIDLGHKLGGYGGFVFNAPFGYQWGFQADLLYAYEGIALKAGKNALTDIQNSQLGQSSLSGILDQIPASFLDKKLAASANFHQVRLAAMLTFTPNDGITVMAGPYASYRVGTNVRFNDNLTDALKAADLTDAEVDAIKTGVKDVIDDNLKRFDVGVSMGVEYAFCSGIFIDFRYNIGLNNLLEKNIDYSAFPGEEGAATINVKDLVGVTPFVRYHTVQLGLGYRF